MFFLGGGFSSSAPPPSPASSVAVCRTLQVVTLTRLHAYRAEDGNNGKNKERDGRPGGPVGRRAAQLEHGLQSDN